MHLDFLLAALTRHRDREAVIWRDAACTYGELLDRMGHWREYLDRHDIRAGRVVVIEADFSPNAIALLLALIERGAIVVPLTTTVAGKRAEFIALAEAEFVLTLDEADDVQLARTDRTPAHELLRRLAGSGHPGLILFSSGSSGRSKAAVHDLVGILEKFRMPRHARRAITFLLYDHIGGFNTLLYQLANGGCIVTVRDRSPDAVLHAIARHRVELLPTSPTFLNLVLLSEAHRRHDLSSLTLVTYGTEPMPESTLRRFHALFPHIQLQQTYGLSEIGILRSKSRSSDSLWVRLGGEGFQTRIVDGLLEVKAESAMLGYLNAESPFTPDGWFRTGDAVEVDGEWLRILGRKSELINVGGEKVYPAEIESVLQEIEGVLEACVVGEANPITGRIVVAKVRLATDEKASAFRARLWRFCEGRLPRYKIPQKVVLLQESLAGARFKKLRREPDAP